MVNSGFPPPQQYAPYVPPPGNGMAIAGMVLGILAVMFCWVPFFNWLLALLAVIFSALGLARSKHVDGRGKGMAIAGLSTGIVGAVAGALIFLLYVQAVKSTVEFARSERGREEARMTVRQYAFEDYPEWAREHPDAECPKTLDELAPGGGRRDPWGQPYVMLCGSSLPPGAHGIAVLSLGPDGKEGTPDDIKSWE
jgi:hypothetical protein